MNSINIALNSIIIIILFYHLFYKKNKNRYIPPCVVMIKNEKFNSYDLRNSEMNSYNKPIIKLNYNGIINTNSRILDKIPIKVKNGSVCSGLLLLS